MAWVVMGYDVLAWESMEKPRKIKDSTRQYWGRSVYCLRFQNESATG